MSDVLSIRRQHQLVLSGTGPRPGPLDHYDAIIVDILSWLPVKSLLRFQCVCKAWRALISESYFINKHLARTKINPSFNLLVSRGDLLFRSIEYQVLLNSLTDDAPIPIRELDFPEINIPLGEDGYVEMVGTCNGLICLLFDRWETQSILIWNPCTRDILVLPQPPRIHDGIYIFGFGYDSSTDDYKVILGHNCDFFLFTLKSGSWKKLESLTKNYVVHNRGCLVNEALHWVGFDGSIRKGIVSFDLEEELFHEISFPYPPNPVDSHLYAEVGILNNCLTLFFHWPETRSEFKMWVMKEHGAKKSWTEVINIPSGILGEEYICMTCISEIGVLMMRLGLNGRLGIYNPKEETFRSLVDFDDTVTYVESLLSPSIGNTGGASF
ncbi:F-box/kelch-repeat protein At3g23880-like [Argentina anserina]|uniref:F-box/kelch-repeat protein At3g23880-like n=1 Tax=Argentina anserina TaxID=57926 RepID=UPI002176321D|nr:F-box/kelch-repeat protein At3g23880-like [Potentilla anserina]